MYADDLTYTLSNPSLEVLIDDSHKVANLILILVEQHESKADDFHIIGHSLGAHIAGYAGERIPGLGRSLKRY